MTKGELLQVVKQSVKRNAFILGVLVTLAGVYGISLWQQPDQPTAHYQPAAVTLAYAEPVRIRIPEIGVDASFEEPLGLAPNQEIEVPEAYDMVGWYKYGPTPGEIGPSVVLGHVDSAARGPEVFYRLRELEVGDNIEIDREDGTTVVFEVERLETVSQSSFPTEEVYGNIDYAGLRLITCSGVFNHGIRRYSHNLIVFARLVKE